VSTYSSCCGARKNRRAFAFPRFFRPLPRAPLPVSATGGGRVASHAGKLNYLLKYYDPNIGIFVSTYSSCCGARKNHRAFAFPRFFRPLPRAPLPVSATGGGRVASHAGCVHQWCANHTSTFLFFRQGFSAAGIDFPVVGWYYLNGKATFAKL